MYKFIILSLLVYISSLSSEELKYKTLFNNPVCNEYKFPNNSYDISGNILFSKQKNVYCTSIDRKNNKLEYVELIKHRKPEANLISLDILLWSMSDLNFINSICNKINKKTKHVYVFSQTPINKKTLYGVNKILKCANEMNVPDIQGALRGFENGGDFKSFHPKIILLSFDDNTSDLYMSSGNPITGSELFFDHTVLTSAKTNNPFIQWHKCISNLFTDKNYSKFKTQLSHKYQSCKKKLKKNIKPFLLPFDSKDLLSYFSLYINKSKSIQIMVQKTDDPTIKKLISHAIDRGVEVEIIKDDDLFWVSKYGNKNQYYNTEYEFTSWLKPLIDKGAKVRYMETNHHGNSYYGGKPGGINFLHTKFVIFNLHNSKKMLYFGSAHLRTVSLGLGSKSNLENVYFTDNNVIIDGFVNYFDNAWNNLSIEPNKMPKIDYIPIQ